MKTLRALLPLHLPRLLFRPLLLLLLSLPLRVDAQAQEVIDATNGIPRAVEIASTGLTRIAPDKGRLASLKYPEALLFVEPDKTGQYFVRPIDKATRSIPLFVITESGLTHSIELRPVDAIAIGSIIVRETPPQPKPQPLSGPASAEQRQLTPDRPTSLDSAVRRLTLQMARGEQSTDVLAVPMNVEIPLWRGTRYIHRSQWRGRSLWGDAFELRNVGTDVIRVAEQEFFTPGVVSVSVEVHEIPPGAFTNVYVVRRKEDRP